MSSPPPITMDRIKQHTRRGARIGIAVLALFAATATVATITADADDDPSDAPPPAHGKPCTTAAESGLTANGVVVRCRPADDGLKWWAEGISTVTEPPPTDRDHDGINDDRDEFPDDPHNTPRRFIRLTCQVGDDTRGFDIEAVPDKGADFTAIWAAKATSCDSDTVAPDSALEQKAHKASGYEEPDIGTLYSICGQVDPDDVYVDAGFAPSREQIAEISGALTLCATHPQAKKWRQAVKRGQADAKLEADGRLFPDGTYLVRKEIKPGTYVTTDVKDCYWERQNRSGEIIDNNFVPSARRVQVTIRSSDYGFISERCGQWRPA